MKSNAARSSSTRATSTHLVRWVLFRSGVLTTGTPFAKKLYVLPKSNESRQPPPPFHTDMHRRSTLVLGEFVRTTDVCPAERSNIHQSLAFLSPADSFTALLGYNTRGTIGVRRVAIIIIAYCTFSRHILHNGTRLITVQPIVQLEIAS